jgi:hypothetical protein
VRDVGEVCSTSAESAGGGDGLREAKVGLAETETATIDDEGLEIGKRRVREGGVSVGVGE